MKQALQKGNGAELRDIASSIREQHLFVHNSFSEIVEKIFENYLFKQKGDDPRRWCSKATCALASSANHDVHLEWRSSQRHVQSEC